MIFNEYGDKNNQALILVHAGGLGDWMFFRHIESLKQDYFLIIPTIDGHAHDTGDFVSIEESANKLLGYLQKNHSNRDFYIYGISLGAQIAMHMVTAYPDLFSKAIIESCLMYPQKKMLKAILPAVSLSYPFASKRWFARLQAKTLYIPYNLFERYYKDSKKMSKETLISITKSNMTFDVSCYSKDVNTKALILYGAKEIGIMKKSAIRINNIFSNSNLKIMENMHHGQLFFTDTNKHISYILEFIRE